MRFIFILIRRLFQQPIFVLRKTKIGFTSRVEKGAVLVNSRIGQYNYLGGGVYLSCVIMGSYCSIASGAKIGGMEHSWWWGSTSSKISEYNVFDRPTLIEDDVWIGANAVVRQGVKIGRGAIIGAGAVVLSDVPPYSIVAGVPGKVIRMRFPNEVIQKILETKYWLYPPAKAKELLNGIEYPDVPGHWCAQGNKDKN